MASDANFSDRFFFFCEKNKRFLKKKKVFFFNKKNMCFFQKKTFFFSKYGININTQVETTLLWDLFIIYDTVSNYFTSLLFI